MKFEIEGEDMLTKTVGRGGISSGRINVPVEWIGRRVRVILMKEGSDSYTEGSK